MKGNMFGKMLAISLAAAVSVGGLVACGGSDGAAEGCLTVKYFDGAYGEEWLETAANKFITYKAGQGVEITKRLIPCDGTKALKDITNQESLADIYMMQEGSWTDFAEGGLLEPLTETYDATVTTSAGETTVKEYLLDGYNLQYFSQPMYDKTNQLPYLPWAMPWSMSQIGLVYNENILQATPHTTAKAGAWAVGDMWQAPPETVEDLLAYITDVNAKESYTVSVYDPKTDGFKEVTKKVSPLTFPGTENHWFKYIIQVWWAQYQGVYEENTLNVAEGDGAFYDFWNPSSMDVYNQEGIKKGIETVQSIFVDTANKKWKNNTENVDSQTVQAAEDTFVKQDAAILLGGSFMYREIETLVPPGVNFKMMNTPVIENAVKNADESTMNINYYTSEDFMVIPAGATNKALAKEFLAFLCNEENVMDFVKKTGSMRPFKVADSVLNADGVATNSFNQSILDIYRTTDVKLVSLPANLTQISQRTPYALYKSKSMNVNGMYDIKAFVKDMKEKTSTQLMNTVYAETEDDFNRWKGTYNG